MTQVVAVSSPSPCGPTLLIFKIKSMIATVERESKSPVGSSSKRMSGSFAKALAIATRCYSPPDNSDGKWSKRSPRLTLFRRAIARFLRSLSECYPKRIIGNSTFSRADMVAKRLNVWNTKPIWRSLRPDKNESEESLSILFPMMNSSPLDDESIVPIRLSIVVLPPPDGPLIMTNSPFLTG